MAASAIESIHWEMTAVNNQIEQILKEQERRSAKLYESIHDLISQTQFSIARDNFIDSWLFIPERYNGRDDPLAANTYVHKIEGYLSLNEYDNERKVNIFGSRLSGVAGFWFTNVVRECPNIGYELLVSKFRLRFIPAHWESKFTAVKYKHRDVVENAWSKKLALYV